MINDDDDDDASANDKHDADISLTTAMITVIKDYVIMQYKDVNGYQ